LRSIGIHVRFYWVCLSEWLNSVGIYKFAFCHFINTKRGQWEVEKTMESWNGVRIATLWNYFNTIALWSEKSCRGCKCLKLNLFAVSKVNNHWILNEMRNHKSNSVARKKIYAKRLLTWFLWVFE
jgi:hypothetical protein